MWHRFGSGLKQVVLCAVQHANAEHEEAGQEHSLSASHLLWALAAEHDLPAGQLLAALGVTPTSVQEVLAQTPSCEALQNGDGVFLTCEAREAVESAYRLAAELGDEYIGGEHLLLAFIQADATDAGHALARLGVAWEPAVRMLMRQQKWRTCAPQGISVPGLRSRSLQKRLRGKAGQMKRVAYGLSQYQQPFMPYLLFRKRTTDNPYPFYTRLRCQPLYWDPLMEHWIVTRYEDVVAALAEPCLSQRIFSAPAWGDENLPALVQREFRCLQGGLDRQMLFQDPPDQPKQRALVSKRFTPKVIARMQAQMQQIADELLDAVQAAGQMDVLADLAVPYPLLVIARMLGLPADDLPQLKKWSQHYFRYLTFETGLKEDLAAYLSVREAQAYFRALLPARRCQVEAGIVQDDLVSLLLQADEAGEFLPEEDVVANCLLLLATGHENTTRLIGTGLLALLRCPAQWQKLCNDPSLAAAAVEEMLRFNSPVQWTLRFLPEDFTWRGHALKKGQRVQIGIGPANRDSSQFSDPDQLDITRSPNRHVAFGYGSHFCLGAALTRLESQVLFGTLSRRFPSLSVLTPPQWRQEGLAFRALESLCVGWSAEK